jgi:hypothetical protein
MEEKVYCIDCRNFRAYDYSYGEYFVYECHADENTKYRDSWLKRTFIYPMRPKKINKHNDCKWYKSKKTVITKPSKRP